jgi:hypothetical protein
MGGKIGIPAPGLAGKLEFAGMVFKHVEPRANRYTDRQHSIILHSRRAGS